MITRIAPTPSGFLHIGNAFNFLLAEELARKHAGVLRLRIDDLDAPRVRPGYLTDIFDALSWLGIRWQAGPRDAADHRAHYSQQQRTPRYDAMIAQLAVTGRVFACTCSRREVLAQSMDGQYPGTCISRGRSLDTPGATLRVQTPGDGATEAFHDAIAGHQSIDLYAHNRHFVIRRADGLPAYHVASLCDDLDGGITHIVRGIDLLHSTAAQLYLARLLGADAFPATVFYHHPLVVDTGGGKLSKSAGSASLKAVRESGAGGSVIRAQFEEWRAWSR